MTGTLTGGSIVTDQSIVVEPAARPARVRTIQTSGRTVDAIAPGHRVALNLAGVGHDELGRGDAVVLPGTWHTTDRFDAELRVLASLDHTVSRRGAYVAYIGSAELPARVRVLGTESLAPGSSGHVRVFLQVAVPLLPGDRYVLRESGRDETVGGGEILDIDPQLPASRAVPDRSLDRVVRERGWVDVDDLERLTGERVDPVVGRWVVAPEVLAATSARLGAAIDDAGELGFEVAALDARERAVLDTLADVVIDGGRARRASAADVLAEHPFVEEARAGGFSPPAAEGVDRGELRELIRRGLLVERDGIVFHPEAVARAAGVAAGLLDEDPGGFTVAVFRDRLGVTRKYALPLVAELDARGMTRRRGDVRIAGPRLPAPG